MVTSGSHHLVEWQCPTCSRKHIATVNSRVTTHGCKYCGIPISVDKRNQKNILDKGSALDLYPELQKEFIACITSNKQLNELSEKSSEKILWKCQTCGHTWAALLSDRTSGHGCPKCSIKRVVQKKLQNIIQTDGSFQDMYPYIANELLYVIGEPELHAENLAPHSHKIGHWRCSVCKHEWETSILNRSYGYGCPSSYQENSKSTYQRAVEDYLQMNYWYADLLHEENCTLKCYNPVTKMLLPYDNELIINNKHLIIEVQGEQHDQVTGLTQRKANKQQCSPQEFLNYQQHKDYIKALFAISNDYFYVAIPYWTIQDGTYCELIDSIIKDMEKDAAEVEAETLSEYL